MKIIYSDGFTIGKNPSSVGGGFLLADENGNEIFKYECHKNPYTCNEGELMGVLKATEIIDDGGTIYTDSMNTIAWIKSCKFKARPDLKEYGIKAKRNIFQKDLKLIYTPRENNLAGQILEHGIAKI